MKFRFDELFDKAQRLAKKYGGDVSINLPFVSFTVSPNDIEKRVAREIMIRLPDKRTLSSKECCDECIDSSLASLQEIRSILVDKQVELSHLHDGTLYLVIEYMAEGIRQFITETERQESRMALEARNNVRAPDVREKYFGALQHLRFHMHSCLSQVSKLAGMETPKVEAYLRSALDWEQEIYLPPASLAPIAIEPQPSVPLEVHAAASRRQGRG